ncbi:glycoprotein 3-alpha-L-fucosyltransferase A [Folsomia candida]|nr:glycoprotein 3-alpha-L-fucosyltransferase A [Folsomia candida]
MFESPDNSWTNISEWNNIFDWTMSYRRDSDVFIPYGELMPISGQSERIVLSANISSRKLVAWAVSNCDMVSSERKALVDELSKFIPIDVYGTCGVHHCPGNSRVQCNDPQRCYEYLGHRYKFYLSFENSICQDYITEKFFLALSNGMVPVVHGPSKNTYQNLAPRNSFIHIADFSSLKDLADYLLHLNQNDEAYMKYFSWREDFVVDKTYYFHRAWCSLCIKLYEEITPIITPTEIIKQKQNHIYASIHNWWFYTNGSSTKKKLCRRVTVKNGTFKYYE